ncbi:hypothetical protein [Mesorhizobium sp. B2-6-6]|uniref:hypothetical protein n=1 Tax=Mesorhizobium sp. B2-6-6 TaxID=2589911 RepID=UPI0011274B87|nr:hypothetical protein FJ437_33225 [Mesorhizobium sp. B2-6-6]
MRVSELYQFDNPESLPFVDVNVLKDSRLFVDPRAIRLDPSPTQYVTDAKTSMTSFFDTVRDLVLHGDQSSRTQGLALLQDFSEPWETRLGMAARGFRGHGGAEMVGGWIWDLLVTNTEAFRRIAVLTQLEDIPLFVDGIGADITSDLTTRIVFGPLAEFTAQMLETYPQFTTGNHKVTTVTARVWDQQQCRWREVQVTLPVANGKELLLVPRNWVRPLLLMHARRFYEVSVLGHVQDTQTVYTTQGQALKPTKEKLKKHSDLACSRPFLLHTTLEAADNNGINLPDRFKRFVDGRFELVPDETLHRKTA